MCCDISQPSLKNEEEKKIKRWKMLPHCLSKRARLSLMHPLLPDQVPEGGDVATFLPTDSKQSERILHILSSPAARWEPSSHQGEWGRKLRWEPCFPGAWFGRSLPKTHCAKTQGMKGVTSLPSQSLGSSLCKEIQKSPSQYKP